MIGSGWVAAFLARGLRVEIYDPAPGVGEKVRDYVAQAWPTLAALGRLAPDADPTAVRVHDELAAALAEADFVQENTPERTEIKRGLFERLDALLPPDVIVASSTSSLPISELAAGLPTAARFVLGHPFNPVYMIPLVEVGGGVATDPDAIAAAEALYVAMGKHPVRLNREVFGHIANRLTSAMYREAVSLVAEGTATVGDVDAAVRHGMALKWVIQGLFTTSHTSGGEGGLAAFLKHFSPGIVRRWETMTTPDLMDASLQAKLVQQLDAAHPGETVAQIAARQDAKLLELLKLLG